MTPRHDALARSRDAFIDALAQIRCDCEQEAPCNEHYEECVEQMNTLLARDVVGAEEGPTLAEENRQLRGLLQQVGSALANANMTADDLRRDLARIVAKKGPMKLLMSNDALRKRIAADPEWPESAGGLPEPVGAGHEPSAVGIEAMAKHIAGYGDQCFEWDDLRHHTSEELAALRDECRDEARKLLALYAGALRAVDGGSGRAEPSNAAQALAEVCVALDGANEDGCAVCGGEYIGDTTHIAHEPACEIPVVRLQVIERLMRGDPPPDSATGKRLLALVAAQHAHEKAAAEARTALGRVPGTTEG